MKETISGLLSMQKILLQRRNQLNELKNEVSKRTMWHEPNKTDEPVYDIKMVDKKITKINMALFKIDKAVKQSNATTNVEINIDFDSLISELE